MKKMNTKGFSLVELIIVIAIMAILVGVLAPTFMKYVDQSRRSSDVSTAEEIRQAILADISDDLNGCMYQAQTGSVAFVGTSGMTTSDLLNGSNATSISTEPTAQGADYKEDQFGVVYDTKNGTCEVWLDSFNLSDPSMAADYKSNGQH